jgi:hypothetical protein
MYKKGIEGFPYYLGIASLADVATRDDRVCVLNILGGESRQVTPVSHVFSGGNVVFGTSPGRRGQAETKGNVGQQSRRRTQSRISVSQLLASIRHIVAVDTRGGFRSASNLARTLGMLSSTVGKGRDEVALSG